ncbi:LrgB family protein [Granulicoccus sp. GXG6511]|uniref:LrgB family protein n=1 Tax=Granulicoccus sp. GXG6511 TaxID=3381351 RepID=UPI003D7E63F8
MTLWNSLTSSPVFGVVVTLGVYQLTVLVARRARGRAYANPVLWSCVLLVAMLGLTRTPVEDYARGGDLIAFFLGPATVALALPLHRQLDRVKEAVIPIVAASVFGASAAVLVAGWVTRALGGGNALVASMLPKSATTPVALAVSETIGGIPALTAALVILTGVLGAVAGPGLLRLIRIRSEIAGGLAMGISAHGIGTARALGESQLMGAFSALAMALSAVVTPIVVALLLPVLV